MRKTQIKLFIILSIICFSFVFTKVVFAVENNENSVKAETVSIIPQNGYQAALTKENQITTKFNFNALGAVWQANNPIQIKVRFLKDNQWTNWLILEKMDELKDNFTTDKNYSQIITTSSTNTFQYQISNPEYLETLNFTYLDSTKNKPVYTKTLSSEPTIIARNYWGADESYRFSNGQEIWPASYYKIQKIILHHTASSDGEGDPSSVVRAIDYWHSKILGWGDIGYNYLIDSDGKIYEGRYGGEGVVGGHAYNEKNNISYNRGSIGIAIIGCYDDGTNSNGEKTCSNPNQLTEATKNALAELIAQKSRLHQINPGQNSHFKGSYTQNILMHRDIDNTACPGNLIANQITPIKKLAVAEFNKLGGLNNYTYDAKLISVSENNLKLAPNSLKEITVEYKNTGNTLWRSYTDDYLQVTDQSVKSNLSAISRYQLALSIPFANPFAQSNNQLIQDLTKANSGQTEYQPTERLLTRASKDVKMWPPNVYPGQIGRFTVSLQANEFYYSPEKNLVLTWKDRGYFPGTEISIKASLVDDLTQSDSRSAQIVYRSIPSVAYANDTGVAILRYKNNSSSYWIKNNLKLKVFGENYSLSPFAKNSWPSQEGNFTPSQDTITPSGFAQFIVPYIAPNQGGEFKQVFQLNNNNLILNEFEYTTTVKSSYNADLTYSNWPLAMLNVWRPTITLTFKNTGTTAWTGPIKLKSSNQEGLKSAFYHDTWEESYLIETKNQTIEPGQSISFTFKTKAPNTPGIYLQDYRLEFGTGTGIFIDNKHEKRLICRIDQY